MDVKTSWINFIIDGNITEMSPMISTNGKYGLCFKLDVLVTLHHKLKTCVACTMAYTTVTALSERTTASVIY